MARTKDPSAATRKAWVTRKRGDVQGRERRLKGPVFDIGDLEGGVSQTFAVTLQDGTVGNFKLDGDPPGGAEAEVVAWEIAKLVGMEDMVPAATIREINLGLSVERGSYAEWQEGVKPQRVVGPRVAKYGDSDHDVMRAAMFDFVIGNSDRHDGNWVVDDGKVRLIDHNLALTDYPYSEFLGHINESPHLADKPIGPYVKPYLDKLPHILAAVRAHGATADERLRQKPVPSWVPADSFAVRAQHLEERVHRAASTTTWREFLDSVGLHAPEERGWPKPSGPHGVGRLS